MHERPNSHDNIYGCVYSSTAHLGIGPLQSMTIPVNAMELSEVYYGLFIGSYI